MERRIRENGFPLGVMYAPFCRTLFIDRREWEQDIRTMRELGFTCLHGFCEWWRIEKEKGVFDFSETDRLVELCSRYGITPILNIATQNGVGFYMPRWMQEEYRGAGMVDCDGNGNAFRTEYATACMDDPWYQMYCQRYLRAVAAHYAGDARVGGWVLWGEPLLHKDGKPICYCEHTVARFRSWLRARYGIIGRLNELWGHEGPSGYADFDGIHPPVGSGRQRGSYASFTDWQTFMEENFAGHIAQADRIFKECGALQPTIAELFCSVNADPLCNDLWALSRTTDIVGVSNFMRPGFETDIAMTVASSLASHQGKSFFVVEADGGPRYPGADRRTPTPEEVCAEAVQSAGANAKGLMYWCYRPRLSDAEGGNYGMCRADGKPLPRAAAAGRASAMLEEQTDIYQKARRIDKAAVLYSNRISHLAAAEGLTDRYVKSVRGAIRLLTDAHITLQIIDEKNIGNGGLQRFDVLILPMAFAMEEKTARAVSEFVKAGGAVIADQGLAEKTEAGVCYLSLPGVGLQNVFGYEKEDILVPDHPSLIGPNPYDIPLFTAMDLVTLSGAETVASLSGRPLITRKGKAWALLWQAFAQYESGIGCAALRETVLGMLLKAEVKPFALGGEDGRDLSMNLLYTEGQRLLTVVHAGYGEKTVDLILPGWKDARVLSGSLNCRMSKTPNCLSLHMDLGPWGTAVFLERIE